ncbi:MAG: filamentous hemagglutinin N-terminal domain-containing protein [Xenococcus sp. MO_188.B8]|nr:filamentous hemagglutinin N-terminal domain-containing protein [Xenococcus sp. MO_188.B8]
MQRASISFFSSTLSLAIFGCLIPLTTVAQVTPDGTTNTTVNVDSNNFEINQGDRVGDNLFHSFNEFSVPTLGSALFNNAADIANIFSRVTGSNISNIDGLLSANGAANLFLINPNGIIFGPNARLNLGGSFFASTADSLLFEDNTEFSASNPQAAPLLKVSIPIGINFRDNPGEIVNRSTVKNSAGDVVGLEVAPGENLTLVGGNINFEAGNTTASGGNIELGGLSVGGRVGINDDGSLSFPEDVAQADITLSNAAKVDVRGTSGGSITINARNLNLEAGDSRFSSIRAGITADSTSPEAQAGDITISATDNVTVDDSGIGNQVAPKAVGSAGDVTINTGSLTLTKGGQVEASTFGQGNAGSVMITASDTITFDGENSGGFPSGATSTVAPEAVGDAGGVTITTGSLTLTNGGRIITNTFGQGNAGAVEIIASDAITIDGDNSGGVPSGVTSTVNSGAVGDAGGVTITTGSLTLTKGGQVDASTGGQGNAGSVEINASDTITIDGGAATSLVNSGAEGDAGDIIINTGSLTLTNGGQVDASNFGQGNAGSVNINANGSVNINANDNEFIEERSFVRSLLGSPIEGSSSGGININAESLSVTNNAELNSSVIIGGKGSAGDIIINADNTVIFDGGFARSRLEKGAEGSGSDIRIDTDSLLVTGVEPKIADFNSGQLVTATFGRGDAGNVIINASDDVVFDGRGSDVFSLVAFDKGMGNGGDIIINSGSLSVNNLAGLIAQSEALGDAGNISITTGSLSLTNGGAVTASTGGQGNAGGVTIKTGSLSLTNGGAVTASTNAQGNAGLVDITANDTITIDGTLSRVTSGVNTGAVGGAQGVTITTGSLTLTNGAFVSALTGGKGNAGSVKITATNNLSLTNNAEISVQSEGQGNSGALSIKANSLALENGASLLASTPVGTGGNIHLQLTEDLTLRDNSFISARALENANGGNVTINADHGSIVAFPNQNNDIIANAEQGNGGKINITTLAIFGLEERSSTPPNQTNDIDASSEFGLQGDIAVNTPEVDPTSGLIELPETVGDATDQISQNPCEQGVGSEFIITGKGGLPPNPNEILNSDEEQVGLVEPVPLRRGDGETGRQGDGEIGRRGDGETGRPETPTPEAVPAQGWIFTDTGEVMLTAYDPTNSGVQRSQQKPISCPTP